MEDTRRINKIHGILVEDSRVPELIKKVDEATPTVVVDSLPLENIKTNAIYAVKKYDYYTSFYGYKLPLITDPAKVDVESLPARLITNGWAEEEIAQVGLVFQLGFIPIEVYDDSDSIVAIQNTLLGNMFKYHLATEEGSLNEKFDTLDGLYTYLFSKDVVNDIVNIMMGGDEEGKAIIETLQNTLRSHNFVWSEIPLPDYQIGVVLNTIYEYYIYNGEEWKSIDNIELVDKLSSSGEVGKVYAVQTGTEPQYKVHIYGKEFDPLNASNYSDFQKALVANFDMNTEYLYVYYGVILGFVPSVGKIVTSTNVTITGISNLYKDDKFVLTDMGGVTTTEANYPKQFSTTDELQSYLFSEQFVADIIEDETINKEFRQQIQQTYKELGFRYGTDIADDEFGVSFKEVPIYAYYMYTGEKWINFDVDDKPVITKNVDWNNGNPIPQLEALTFTEAEFDSLKNNAELEIICNMSNKPLFTMYANKTLLTDSDVADGIEYEITVVGAFSTKRCRMTLTNKNGKIEVDIVEPTNVTSSYTTIPVSAWTEGGVDVYKHSAFTNVGDVETQSRVIVMFNKADAESGNFSPYVDTVDGGLTIYAKEKPTKDVSIHVEVFN